MLKKLYKIITETYGGIDILISNAGTAIGGSIAEVNDKTLRQSLKIISFLIKIVLQNN